MLLALEGAFVKKLLLGLILLAALVGVSYLKVIRDSDRETEAFRRGRTAADVRNATTAAAADSLTTLVAARDSKVAALTDTVVARERAQARLSDSLSSEIASRDKEISQLKAKTTAAKSAPGTKSTATSRATSSEHEILAHYRQAVDKLPGDLSTYERSVAIREIRQETATKFAITVDRLNKIRENNNLEY